MVSIPDCLARINAVLQLLGQLENSGPPPASKQAINLLPILTIQQDDIDKECSVCMDHFKLEDNVKKLPCNHIFHVSCIDPWLNLHNTCPICRKLVEENCPTNETNNSLFNHSFPQNRNNDDDHTYST